MIGKVRRKLGQDYGFTLIELLIVVLIIGVLSGIVVLAVSNSTGDAKAKACTQNAANLLTAMENYKATSTALGGGEGAYPTPSAAPAPLATASPMPSINGSALPPGAIYLPPDGAQKLVPTFIKTLPSPYPTPSGTADAVSSSGYMIWVTSATNGSAFVTVNGVQSGCKNAGL